MVGNTLHQIGRILHDIKSSWYFRIWGILWLACAVIVAAILIVLTKTSAAEFIQKDVQVWVENATAIQFPRFELRGGYGVPENEQIISLNCTHNQVPVATSACPNEVSTFCQTVYADSFFTSQVTSSLVFGDERILCYMTTTGNSSVLGNLMAFQIEGSNQQSVGPSSYTSIWIAPNQNAWVMLEKSIWNSASQNITDWDRSLLYHSTVSVPGQYYIEVIIGSYNVWHIDQTDVYNGVMAMGDIGGFAFFLLVIHSIIMLFVGLCFLNNSTFLKNTGSDSTDYSQLKH